MQKNYKAELTIDGITTDITEDIQNWDNIKVSPEREDYGGIVRKFTNKFEFVGEAYELIKDQYINYYLKSYVQISLYTKDENRNYHLRFTNFLDFSSYSDNGYTISCNTVDNMLATKIKAGKSQTYDIPVSEISLDSKLYYDRLELKANTDFIGAPPRLDDVKDMYELDLGETYSTYENKPLASATLFPVSHLTPEDPNGGFEYSDIIFRQFYGVDNLGEGDGINLGDNSFLIKCLKPVNNVTLNIKFGLSFNVSEQAADPYDYTFTPKAPYRINICKGTKNENGTYRLTNVYHKDTFDINTTKILDASIIQNFNKDDVLTCIITVPTLTCDQDEKIQKWFNVSLSVIKLEKTTGLMNITFISRGDPLTIDITTPIRLLQRIVKEITKEDINCQVISNGIQRLDISHLCAAESIRGIEKAKFHTSFSKFAEYMLSEYGYIYQITEDAVIFKHRDMLYNQEIVKEITDFTDFDLSVDSSLIYSGVKVGYEKQDYDSINGRDEFRFTNSFSTEIFINDSVLTLESPYRADAYGIEFLAQKWGEKTKDDFSDNDIFIIGCQYVPTYNRYDLVRGVSVGVISPSTMFNTMYSPIRMLEANKSFIGACTDKLIFTASEGNADVVLDGIPEKSTVYISPYERAFTVNKVTFNTAETALPQNMDGLVRLKYKSTTYEGYIINTELNYTKGESSKYTIIIKNMT